LIHVRNLFFIVLDANREAVLREIIWYRAMCFRKPVGPWRQCKHKMRRDLIAEGLGSYDEWGAFYVTVPGDFEVRREQVQSKAA
jgi:hypothetical protein